MIVYGEKFPDSKHVAKFWDHVPVQEDQPYPEMYISKIKVNTICSRCGENFRLYHVDDKVWKKIPDSYQNQTICIDCVVERLER